MNAVRKGLGRGLGALLPVEPREGEAVGDLNLDEIEPNPFQPRRVFDEEKLRELATSVREHGVLQPLIVRRRGAGYQIVAGERRWRAARLAGLKAVPAVVRDVSDEDLLEVALVENVQREDLNPIELARGYEALIDQLGLTHEELALRLGKSRAVIGNHLRLLSLDGDVQAWLEQGKLSMGHARAIAVLDSAVVQREVARRAIEREMSVREIEALARRRGEDAGAKVRETVRPRPEPALATFEEGLKERLGTRVRIRPGKSRGMVEIEYYGDEDLERIYRLITGRSPDAW